MNPITTNLWYDSQAEEAAKYYVQVFQGAPGADPPGRHLFDCRPRRGHRYLTSDAPAGFSCPANAPRHPTDRAAHRADAAHAQSRKNQQRI